MHKKQKITQAEFLAATKQRTKPVHAGKRIGIYAGVFNPVHAGHIAFALQAMKAATLDRVVFVPERLPRHKPGVEHFGHRVAMLQRATAPYANMAVLELADKQFTVQRTWHHLRQLFAGAELALLMGSDAVLHLPEWSRAEVLLGQSELVVGVREQHQLHELQEIITAWKIQPRHTYVVKSFAPHVSSTAIRHALGLRQTTHGLLASVHRYAHRNWLYISLEKATKNV